MSLVKTNSELHYASVLLRLGIGALFFFAGVGKIGPGISATVDGFVAMFADTWIPTFMIVGYAGSIMIIELLLGVWLISGFKLKWAWIASGLLLISLALGMLVIKKTDVAGTNFNYLLIAVIGLIVSQYDQWQFGKGVQK